MRFFLALRPLLPILCATAIAAAQSTDATLSGVVVDPSGKAIPHATIEILNEATGVRYPAETNDVGIYAASILPPGQYRAQVSKAGFKTIIKPGIVLNVQGAVAVNFTLPLGATSESITVEAGSSLINTSDASVSTVVNRNFVQNIPLNGRSFQDLISMTPGVVTQSPQAGSSLAFNGDFSVNGQRTESNYYTVDGVSANSGSGNGYGGTQSGTSGSLPSSTALGTTQTLVPVDALREFRVQSSTYSAEYGRAPGGQFSLVTRSGTNDLHGSLFDYLRNSSFDANDWFNDYYGSPQPPLRQNDFGGTIGGPVVVPQFYSGRSRFFFFGSYEGLRLTQPQAAAVQYVPDTALRQGAPPAIQPILNAFPVQNGQDYVGDGIAEFIKAYSLPSQLDSYNARLDYNISSKCSLFFRFGDTPSDTTSRSLSVLTKSSIDSRSFTLGASNLISPRLTNDFRLGYSQGDSSVAGPNIDNFGGATPVNFAQAMGVTANLDTAGPTFTLYVPGVGSTTLETSVAANKTRQWNVVDAVALAHRRHEFKFGVDYRFIKSPTTNLTPIILATYQGEQQVLSNAGSLWVENQVGAAPVTHETALFAQDEWHITPTFALSYGVRWEVDPPPSEAHGADAFTLLGSIANPGSLSVAPRGTSLWKTPFFNLAPRLGLAWIPQNRAGWETVFHTGTGVFYDSYNQLAVQAFGGLGFAASQSFATAALPLTSFQLDFSPSVTAPYTGSTVYAFPEHLQLPYTLEWNASVEQALGKAQMFSFAYVGSNGRRLPGEQELYLYPENPNFGYVIYFPNNITSNFQSFQARFQRNVSKGIHALASYTWSHSLDFGSTGLALPEQRGNSDYDVRHNFSGGMTWDLPTMRTGTFSRALASDWGLDMRVTARTGFPVTLTGNFLVDPATGSYYYGNVDLVPGQTFYRYGDEYPGGRILNKSAFSLPPGTSPGDAPRNFLRGFGATQVNLAVRRDFRLYREFGLQFRAEAFNVLNHPNFGFVNPYLTNAMFGYATQMLNQSLGTMSPQYQQGGPRSMQFSLRASF